MRQILTVPMDRVRSISNDLWAGILTGLVLIPMGMAYGIITGVGPASGLYGVAIIGLIAAIAGGTRGLISGPSIVVSIVLAPVVAQYGLATAFAAGMLAGLVLIALGLFRLGRFVAYIPYSLLSGLFTAVGVHLILVQVLQAIGQQPAPVNINIIGTWMDSALNYHALAITGITVLVGLAWPRRLARYAPGQLVALAVATVVGVLWLTSAPTIGDIPRSLPGLSQPVFSPAIISPGITVAFLAATTTLTFCLQADVITGEVHRPNRELVGQGLGNVVAGLIGGNPGSVSVATFINLQAGGRGMIAGIVAASVVGLSLAAVPFSIIPLPALAGIIMVSGYQIIDWKYFRHVRQIPFGYTAIMLTTAVGAILIDFTTAILVGLAVSALVNANRSQEGELEQLISVPLLDREIWPDAEPYDSRVGLVRLPTRVSMASARELSRILGGDLRGHEAVIVDFGQTAYLDDTAANIMGKLIASKLVVVVGLQGEPARVMEGLGDIGEARTARDVEEAKATVRGCLCNMETEYRT